MHLFGWPWLYELDENDPIGLIRRDGTAKAAYAAWQALSSPGR